MHNILRITIATFMAFGFLIAPTSHLSAQNGAVASVNRKAPATKKVKLQVNEVARFPGCEFSALSTEEKVKCSEEKMQAFIQKNLEYPEIAQAADFKPRIVRVDLTVNEDGKIHSPRVAQPGIKEYDDQARMVVVKMNQQGLLWTPAVFEQKPIKSHHTVTVHFNWEGRNAAFPNLTQGDDIFEYVDEPAAFIGCQVAGRKDREVRSCVQERMADFFARNMRYPTDAITVGLEGDVEVEFVVDKTGLIQNITMKNDIGLGCGEEAIRLIKMMNNSDLVWIPGEEDGQNVNVLEKTTVKFRIPKEKLPSTKLAKIDARKVFITEREGFEAFLDDKLTYPQGEDINPCAQGVIDVKFKVAPVTEEIIIIDMIDYNDLGKDFKASVTEFLQESKGEWNVAYRNLGTETVFQLSIPFTPESLTCTQATKGYKSAVFQALDGAELLTSKNTQNDGLSILDDVVRNFPADNKMRHLRGMALYKANRRVEACVDLSFVSKQNRNIPVPKTCK